MISRNIKSNRYEFVDCAKGLAAIFVVIGHYGTNIFLRNFGYSFHVPIFFLISGFFIINQKSFFSFIKNKLFKLIFPVVIFILLKNFTAGGTISSIFNNLGKDLLSCFYGSYYIPEALKNIFAPLPWFTFCLFASDIIFYFTIKIFKNKKYVILTSLLCSILGFFLSNFGIYEIGNIIRLPFSLDIALYNQIYLCLGWLCFKKLKEINMNIRTLLIYIIVSVFLIASISINYTFKVPNCFIMDMNRRDISYISMLISLFICFAIIMIAKKIESNSILCKIFSYIGRITLVMYFFQGFELPIFRDLYSNSGLSIILRIVQCAIISEIIRFVPFVNSSFGLKCRIDSGLTNDKL